MPGVLSWASVWSLVVATGLGGPSLPDDTVVLLQQPLPAHGAELTQDPNLRPKHKPVIFVHVHKAGGTGMCQLALANKERFMANADPVLCNSHTLMISKTGFDDYHAWTPMVHMDCDKRRMQWLASGFTWLTVERPFSAAEFCPDQFFYATMIRHPIDLALSMVNYLDISPSTGTFMTKLEWSRFGGAWPQIVNCLELRQAGRLSACAKVDFTPTVKAYWVYFDNFMVRMFGGLDVWTLPPGAVNATHRQLAIEQLKRFDVVLTVDQFGSNRTKARLRELFGWEDLGAIDQRVMQHTERFAEFSEADVERIKRLNKHDMILYDTFKALGGGAPSA